MDAITQTVQSVDPVGNATTFRVVVLAWLGTFSIILLTLRPIITAAIQIVMDARGQWDGKDRRRG